jgi:hypothetical protein
MGNSHYKSVMKERNLNLDTKAVYCYRTFENQFYTQGTYKCGTYEYYYPDNSHQIFSSSVIFQCHECEIKEEEIKEKLFFNHKFVINIEENLDKIFKKDDIQILLNVMYKENLNKNEFFLLFKSKEKLMKGIMNIKFNEFGLKWSDKFNKYIYSESYKNNWEKDGKYKIKREFVNCPWTYLNLAIKFQKYDIVKFLLENGARVDIKDNFGDNSLDFAKNNQFFDIKIFNLLEQYNLTKNYFYKFEIYSDIKILYL